MTSISTEFNDDEGKEGKKQERFLHQMVTFARST